MLSEAVNRQTETQPARQTDRQPDRQTDVKTYPPSFGVDKNVLSYLLDKCFGWIWLQLLGD